MTTLASSTAFVPRPLAPFTEEGVFIRRALLHSLRNTESAVMAIMLPVMLMLLFTFVFGGAIDGSGDYVDYVVPGIILLCAGFGAAATAVSVSQDMTTGIIDRFRTMPIRASAVLTGHIVASLVRNLIATGVVIGVALLVGFRPNGGVVDWIAAIALVALYILAITSLFAAVGLAASNAEAASGYGFILLFLPYLSSAFVPVETMPAWLQWFAAHQPVTPLVETIRALLLGGDASTRWPTAVAWSVGIIVAASIWGALLFRRKAGRR
ncbi:ABC transporter permease [Naasia lichenicola]|uniref:Transport permease protein n=1 Tax=Naasia lichenicola TaxID=2565933 RepID=A0A4S4FSJ9_9MICO|nr:ABC transporter permease [Naasia lichenicola]THG32882.1 ABC transporter permease [Naasia lichenicola]